MLQISFASAPSRGSWSRSRRDSPARSSRAPCPSRSRRWVEDVARRVDADPVLDRRAPLCAITSTMVKTFEIDWIENGVSASPMVNPGRRRSRARSRRGRRDLRQRRDVWGVLFRPSGPGASRARPSARPRRRPSQRTRPQPRCRPARHRPRARGQRRATRRPRGNSDANEHGVLRVLRDADVAVMPSACRPPSEQQYATPTCVRNASPDDRLCCLIVAVQRLDADAQPIAQLPRD